MKGKSRWLTLGLVALAVVALLGVGGWFWRDYVIRSQADRNLQRVKQLLAENRGVEALTLIRQHHRTHPAQSVAVREVWLALELEAATQAGALARLLALYEKSPAAFKDHEAAALLLGRALVHGGNFTALESLRAEWRGREKLVAGWFELDVDALLVGGRREEAVQMLNKRSFEGSADCGRLARLALLNTPANLKEAWQFLDRAARLDPRNAEVRLFRGQILESVGQSALAHNEFQAAFLSDTNQPFFREQFGEFLRRHGRYELALVTWAGGLTNAQATDVLWLRSAFWSRVARRVKTGLAGEPPYGPQSAFVDYLLALPPSQFWDSAAFAKLAEGPRYLKELPETFWLQLLAALQGGDEAEATRLLEFNPFRARSYHVELESALVRVLGYRKTGRLEFPVHVNLPVGEAGATNRHPLFVALDGQAREPKGALPAEVGAVLRGRNGFAAVLLAAGWAEAALGLPRDEVLPAGTPDWLAYGFVQALRFNRGNAAALEFAGRQRATSPLEVLQCEILLSEGRTNAALPRLARVAGEDSPAGRRAAQLIAETHLDRREVAAARGALAAYPKFTGTVAGQVLLARLALLENQVAEATRIYTGIRAASDEAKMFLAKKAFQDRDWALARQLTEELVKEYPERTELRHNLEAIRKAEAGK